MIYLHELTFRVSYVQTYQDQKLPLYLFSCFTAKMVWSNFGPYHGLCYEGALTKCIGIIPTPWTKKCVLGLGILLPQPEL